MFYNVLAARWVHPVVVNWFQIMFLFLVRQPKRLVNNDFDGCELISNYVLIFGSTTILMNGCKVLKLWIDFKLCSYFWFDNFYLLRNLHSRVVNWFQIMFLFLVRQLKQYVIDYACCCELISNYVLIFGSTTKSLYLRLHLQLWIDFKLCSYFWFDNLVATLKAASCVVNWFQIMFLFLVRQLFL